MITKGKTKKLYQNVFAALFMGAATNFALAAGPGTLALPAPGTYHLDKIQQVPFSLVRIDDRFLPHLLSSYTTGKITLLTFFYSQCRDPQGCPLAWNAFQIIRDKVIADPALKGKVRLVFYSFDPVHDAQTLPVFAASYKNHADIIPWYFITGWNDHFLKETLTNFGQAIALDTDTVGKQQVVINHLLKVFLIDRDGWVREIYTSAFLAPAAVFGDIETLSLEESKSQIGD